MKMRGYVLFGFLVLLCVALSWNALAATKTTPAPVAAPADPVEGLWYTEGNEGGVEIYSCGGQICGRFYWLKDDEADGDISRDTHNPDTSKRGEPLCDMTFMTGFVPDGKGKYNSGTIYSPRHGANFNAEMTLTDANTLHLRGYLLSPILGQTQTWKRAPTMPKCAMTVQPKG